MSLNDRKSKFNKMMIVVIILAISGLGLACFNTITILINSSGDVESQKSLVRVYLNYSQYVPSTSPTLINWTTADYDVYSDFDLLNDEFITPNDGYFRFHCNVNIGTIALIVDIEMWVDSTVEVLNRFDNNFETITLTNVVYLLKGESVTFVILFQGQAGIVGGGSHRTYLTIEEL